jgi:hypothetical protein
MDKLVSAAISEVRVLTASDLVCAEPAYICCLIITANASGVATANIYDGFSTAGKLLLPMASLQYFMNNVNFIVPIYCSNGIYVEVGSNVQGITVHYLRENVI